jgi:PEGA domain
MRLARIVGGLACLGFMGCATVFPPGPDLVSIQSEPAGAEVFINGEARGQTPLGLPLTCTPPPTVRVEKDGYEPYAMVLPTTPGWGGYGSYRWPVDKCTPTFHVTMGRRIK